MVSVSTPSCNLGESLEATLRSVITQDHASLECVVIDGGSTDGSADIIQRHVADLAYRVNQPTVG